MTDDTQTPQAEYVTVNTVEELADLVKNAPSTPLAIPDGEPHSAERLLGSIRHMQTRGGLRDPENWLPATVLTSAPTPQTPDDVREALALVDDAIVRIPKLGGAGAIYEKELIAVLKTARATLSAISARPTVSAETHSEDTLRKVYRGLEAAGIHTIDARDAVTEMQNQGVLFRERAAGVGVEGE